MSKLILIRGLPGSGKSTLATEIDKSSHVDYCLLNHWEADKFYETVCGGYEFNPEFIKDAHAWCYYNTLQSLYKGYTAVVSNTFTTNWEMERYFQLKDRFPDLEIIVINVTTQFETIHGVPEATMEKMKNRWEDVAYQDAIVYNYPEDAHKMYFLED